MADIEASDRAQAVKALADKNAAAQAAALQAIAKQEAADRAAEAQAAATAKALADKEAAARRAKALVKPKPLYRTYNLHSMCMMNIHGLIDNSKPKVYRNEYIDSDHSFKIPNNNTKYDSNRYPYDKNGLAWPYGIPYAVMSYDTEIRADYIDNCALSSMPDTTNKDTSLMWLATTYESSENEPNPKEKIELVPSTMTADMYYRDFYIKVTSETASTVVDPKIKSKYLCGYNCTIE